ncbi:MAG: hypothetical protein BGO54_06020 [Sphingobacteriales bacterium 46-32]|nr:MAG: hypothetical protein BGO54_06020 [Sphingobacteriales bacterium 46-32]
MSLEVSAVTLTLIIITTIISIGAFSNQKIMDDLIFYPPAIARGQWYRFFSSGLIHAHYPHLALNMLSLYFFGPYVEAMFIDYFQQWGRPLFLALYILALAVSDIPSYIKHRHNSYYLSLGASGAVSAVIFASILLNPISDIRLFFSIPIPGFLYGLLFLAGSYYMAKKGTDNIGHSAHFWGAIFGLTFTGAAGWLLLHENFFVQFMRYLRYYLNL